jgi:CRISPR-associated protein Cas5
MKINLDIIFQKPSLDKKVKLTIMPLAPLSMVSAIPGSYYKTDDIPDKYKICGLFENILGWHFDKEDRLKIHKKIKEHHKKEFKSSEYEPQHSASGFQPLLFNFFETGMVLKHQSYFYNDLVKMCARRTDADVHPKGTPNLDYKILKEKKWVRLKEKEIEKYREEKKKLEKDKEKNKDRLKELESLIPKQGQGPLLDLYKQNLLQFPMYYTSPSVREFAYTEGSIQISLNIHNTLYEALSLSLNNCSTAYLGNSEGWVEINLEEI